MNVEIEDLAGDTTGANSERSRPVRILSMSIEYPNPEEPGRGLFVRSRLQHVAALSELKVVAPIPVLDYSDPHRRVFRRSSAPRRRADELLEVLHPRWAYPPYGTPVNVLCLFTSVLPHLKRLRRGFQFDILDVHFGYPDGVAGALAAAVLRVPFVITLRGNEPIFAESRSRRWCIQWALRRASRVITVSQKLAEFAIGLGVPPERVRTIGNGVDTDRFRPLNRPASRDRYAIPQAAKVILSVGSLVEAKGHHRVIRAVAELVAGGVDAHLLIVGTVTRGGRPFDDALRRMIYDLGVGSRVQMLGWIAPDRLPELMSAADVFCLASDAEGWPNVIHEALSCGSPVVATRVGAVPDLIPGEAYGIIVPVNDQPALNQALRHALEKPWRREAISAWGQSRSWKQVAREVLAEISQVLKCAE